MTPQVFLTLRGYFDFCWPRWPRVAHEIRFPIVIIDEDYRSDNTSGLGIRALAAGH